MDVYLVLMKIQRNSGNGFTYQTSVHYSKVPYSFAGSGENGNLELKWAAHCWCLIPAITGQETLAERFRYTLRCVSCPHIRSSSKTIADSLIKMYRGTCFKKSVIIKTSIGIILWPTSHEPERWRFPVKVKGITPRMLTALISRETFRCLRIDLKLDVGRNIPYQWYQNSGNTRPPNGNRSLHE